MPNLDKFRQKLARSAMLAQADGLGVVLISATERGVIVSSSGSGDVRNAAAEAIASRVEDLLAEGAIVVPRTLRDPV